MNCTRILLALALIAFCCITYSLSLRCYICENKNACRNPKKYECTQANAIATRSYLDVHYKGVNPNASSPNYSCIRDVLKVPGAEYHWKGCTFHNVGGCELRVKDHYAQNKYERDCRLCQSRDGCNPAGRAAADGWTPLAALVAVAAIGHYAWRN